MEAKLRRLSERLHAIKPLLQVKAPAPPALRRLAPAASATDTQLRPAESESFSLDFHRRLAAFLRACGRGGALRGRGVAFAARRFSGRGMPDSA